MIVCGKGWKYIYICVVYTTLLLINQEDQQHKQQQQQDKQNMICSCQCPHLDKSLARPMLFYSRNCWQQNWVQFVLYIKQWLYIFGNLWLKLWLNNCCKNTGYYSIFQLSFLLLLNYYQYQNNCNNTISSVSAVVYIWYDKVVWLAKNDDGIMHNKRIYRDHPKQDHNNNK